MRARRTYTSLVRTTLRSYQATGHDRQVIALPTQKSQKLLTYLVQFGLLYNKRVSLRAGARAPSLPCTEAGDPVLPFRGGRAAPWSWVLRPAAPAHRAADRAGAMPVLAAPKQARPNPTEGERTERISNEFLEGSAAWPNCVPGSSARASPSLLTKAPRIGKTGSVGYKENKKQSKHKPYQSNKDRCTGTHRATISR
ncbi:unnamed protein product [Pleuronectes platessa]|uniref:Uncharacterized protein n=1 Tax=Pleuronectes platessa TaxID=8262 RepID=A0A9N7W186_PLEPL|nr:unnamed protein product [Pleuronectes platessa]